MFSVYVFWPQEDDVETALGLIHVCVQGDRNKPAILTYHDIGMNSECTTITSGSVILQ